MGDAARLARSLFENLAERGRPGEQFGSPRPHRIEMGVQRLGEFRLHFHVADLARAVARLEVVHLSRIRIECVMVHEHGVAFDGARHVGANPLRIREHLHDLFQHGGCIIGKIDGVAVALGHLPVVEAGEPRKLRQERLRLHKQLAVEVVKTSDDLATEFQMRDLVLADRHVPRIVDDDVGRLEQRIAEKAQRRQIFVRDLLHLLFVGRHSLEP